MAYHPSLPDAVILLSEPLNEPEDAAYDRWLSECEIDAELERLHENGVLINDHVT